MRRAAFLSLLLMATAAPAQEPGRRPSTIPLQLIDGRLFITVRVGPGEETLALLDSTAEESVIDDDFARRLGVREPTREERDPHPGPPPSPQDIEAQMLRSLETHVSVEMGLFGFGWTMPHRELGPIGGATNRPLDLMIGRDMLIPLPYRIDIAGGTLSLGRGSPARGVRLPVAGAEEGRPTFAVTIGATEARAMIDTGHERVRISRAFARRANLAGTERAAIIPELSVAGLAFRDVAASIDADLPADIALGTSILRHFVVTTGYVDGAIWLEPKS
jgi:hypothetical protein